MMSYWKPGCHLADTHMYGENQETPYTVYLCICRNEDYCNEERPRLIRNTRKATFGKKSYELAIREDVSCQKYKLRQSSEGDFSVVQIGKIGDEGFPTCKATGSTLLSTDNETLRPHNDGRWIFGEWIGNRANDSELLPISEEMIWNEKLPVFDGGEYGYQFAPGKIEYVRYCHGVDYSILWQYYPSQDPCNQFTFAGFSEKVVTCHIKESGNDAISNKTCQSQSCLYVIDEKKNTSKAGCLWQNWFLSEGRLEVGVYSVISHVQIVVCAEDFCNSDRETAQRSANFCVPVYPSFPINKGDHFYNMKCTQRISTSASVRFKKMTMIFLLALISVL